MSWNESIKYVPLEPIGPFAWPADCRFQMTESHRAAAVVAAQAIESFRSKPGHWPNLLILPDGKFYAALFVANADEGMTIYGMRVVFARIDKATAVFCADEDLHEAPGEPY